MGKFVSIRGWIECDRNDINTIKNIYEKYKHQYDESIEIEKRHLYQQGWNFPELNINWTAYIFYGADIREYNSDFIKDQLLEISKLGVDISGYFLIDDYDGEKKFCWQIVDGKFLETPQGEILFNK